MKHCKFTAILFVSLIIYISAHSAKIKSITSTELKTIPKHKVHSTIINKINNPLIKTSNGINPICIKLKAETQLAQRNKQIRQLLNKKYLNLSKHIIKRIGKISEANERIFTRAFARAWSSAPRSTSLHGRYGCGQKKNV